MARFLLFAFVLISRVIGGLSTEKLPPPEYGKRISILSIDGGGIKGIIPATILEHLDAVLKKKDPTASIAHYFDVIAGTSTGGIVTAMLATPNTSHTNPLPLFTPSHVVKFYRENGPRVFQPNHEIGPKYDSSFLRNITRVLLKDTRLRQTLTNVVIPTFDLKKLKPVIFSSYKVKTDPYLDAKLSDICIGTSAAPTFLAPYKFHNHGVEFNLIDGAASADNPALVAVSEVIRESWNKHREIMLLSLGTGRTKVVEKYDADSAAKWSFVEWIDPALDITDQSSTDMILYYISTVFPGLMPAHNYLRIQEYNMEASENDMTNVTEANMDNLVNIGKKLLDEKVKRMDVTSFVPTQIDQTNKQALHSFAEKLYKERQLRLKRKTMEKGGRPFAVEPKQLT